MDKLKSVALGIVTSIGGFVDAGELVTTHQAGAYFGFRLLWVVPLSVLIIATFTEMAGRVAAASERATFDLVRERFGAGAAAIPLVAVMIVNLLTLVAEIAGMAFVAEMMTGVSYLLWVPLAAFLLWLMMWKGTFAIIEDVPSLLGLTILVFAWTAIALHIPLDTVTTEALHGGTGGKSMALYLYFAVALIGSYAAPYEILFYASGANEDRWDRSYKWANRGIAIVGMVFGGTAAGAMILVAATIFHPADVRIEHIATAAIGPAQVLGRTGFILFLLGAFSCSFAAGIETASASTYALSEYFGWNWGKDRRPAESARYTLAYTAAIIAAVLILLTTVNPITITELAMVFNAIALPFVLFPMLVIANDRRYVGDDMRNGVLANVLGAGFFVLMCVVSVAGIPLLIATSGGGG
jgi:Mn2+/Fe2+ NRAMP family transporter